MLVPGRADARRSTSTPTTTPRSSTRRAPPATRRARCRPTGPWCTALLAFGCRAAVNGLTNPPTGEPHPYPTSFILVVPLFHVTGCVAVMLSSWLAGAKLVLMYKWSPERALELIERERITNFVGVPTMSWDLLESPDFADRDTSSLLAVGGGGAPAPPELVRRVESNFSKGRPADRLRHDRDQRLRPGQHRRRLRPQAEQQRPVRASDGRQDRRRPTARPLPAGEVGEICFAGPTLIRGYWNKPEATAETIVDGWLYSGDIGRLDDEGFIYVEDRAKDMVIRAGENIYCAEVEAAIYEHPAVYEAAVFGIPHERLGEELVAAVLLKPGATVTAEELQAHVAEKLAPFKVPSKVDVRRRAAAPRRHRQDPQARAARHPAGRGLTRTRPSRPAVSRARSHRTSGRRSGAVEAGHRRLEQVDERRDLRASARPMPNALSCTRSAGRTATLAERRSAGTALTGARVTPRPAAASWTAVSTWRVCTRRAGLEPGRRAGLAHEAVQPVVRVEHHPRLVGQPVQPTVRPSRRPQLGRHDDDVALPPDRARPTRRTSCPAPRRRGRPRRR